MKQTILICTIALSAVAANARTWTTTTGRAVEAKVVRIKPDRTVILKTTRGKVVTAPFDTFVEEDIEYLETRLALPFELHSVSWQKMNEIFGIEIWRDSFLWDDPTAEVGARLEMDKESTTDFMENYRTYPLGEKKVLTEPVYTTALYGGPKYADSLSFVFLNQGDLYCEGNYVNPDVLKTIRETGMRLRDYLIPVLGKPKRDSLGSGEMREKVWRWDWNGHAILLSLQEEQYIALRIIPVARAENGGRNAKVSDADLEHRLATCVERRGNDDVVVCNIPMVDQGPKGYCVPATWERYLRYLDIPADMYLLALAGNTGLGGGTSIQQMMDAADNIISSNGRKLKKINTAPTVANISRYIDRGLPIMWTLKTTPEFRKAIYENTARRKGEEPEKKKYDSGYGYHICLIIGYNKRTGEIATSDSWGADFAERWVPLEEIRKATVGGMSVIRW